MAVVKSFMIYKKDDKMSINTGKLVVYGLSTRPWTIDDEYQIGIDYRQNEGLIQ
jgi:hypothetical protein